MVLAPPFAACAESAGTRARKNKFRDREQPVHQVVACDRKRQYGSALAEVRAAGSSGVQNRMRFDAPWPDAQVEDGNMSDDNRSLSGLTDGEAKEFHEIFMRSFLGFTAVAVVAHILAWAWRPWF